MIIRGTTKLLFIPKNLQFHHVYASMKGCIPCITMGRLQFMSSLKRPFISRERGDETIAEKPSAKPHVRPNFFVGVQVSNPVIHEAVRAVQNLVISKKPVYKSVLIKLITLHITLCMLHLPGNDDIRRAKLALKKLEEVIKESLVKSPVNLKFKGIGTFKNEVVYAKIEPGESLTELCNIHISLTNALRDEGLKVMDKFTPHLTIMKLSKDRSLRKKKIFKIPQTLYGDESDVVFGDQTVRFIQLLGLGNHPPNSYYNCYHSIDLGICDEELEDHLSCCGVQSVIPTNVVELNAEEEVVDESMDAVATADEAAKDAGRLCGVSENSEPGNVNEKVSCDTLGNKNEVTELGMSEVTSKLDGSQSFNVEGRELKIIEKDSREIVGEAVELPVVVKSESFAGQASDGEEIQKIPESSQDGNVQG